MIALRPRFWVGRNGEYPPHYLYISALQLYTQRMSHYSAARARELFSEVIDQSSREAVFIERRGSVAAVVISPAQYEEMLDALEERDDILAFDQALLEAGPNVPWDEIKADLGLA